MLIYAAANQGRSSTNFIMLRWKCEPASAMDEAGSRTSLQLIICAPIRSSNRIIRVCFAQIIAE